MRRFDKKKNIQKANLIAEQRYLESKGLIKEEMDLNEADSTILGGIAKNMYLILSKRKPNQPLDKEGSPLKNTKGDFIKYENKVQMSYNPTGQATKEIGTGSSEISLNKYNSVINVGGFISKEEAESALKYVEEEYPNQVTVQLIEHDMSKKYEWAERYASRWNLQIELKSDKEVARTQSGTKMRPYLK